MMSSYDAANLEAMSAAVAYQKAMQDLVVEKLDLGRQRGVVLDFGSGRGDYAKAIQPRTAMSVVGVEPDTALHTCYAENKVLAGLADIPDESLDAAYSLNVFEHIQDDLGALRELLVKCKPGAPVFILVPANPNLWTAMDTLVGHCRRYLPGDLRELSEQAAATVVEEGWFDKTGYLATQVYKTLNRVRSKAETGVVTKNQLRLFDAVFRVAEPVLRAVPGNFGKNCWILLRKPG